MESKQRSLKRPRVAVDHHDEDTVEDRGIVKKGKTDSRRSLFVRSLPNNATSESLTNFFSQYFPVKHATVVVDHESQESKGYGFVTFADADDASEAKATLDKKVWDGKHLRIEVAEPRQRNVTTKDSAPVPAWKLAREESLRHPPKLIVRNLPWSIKSSEQLSKLFASYGKVKFADLPQKKGKLKGFGFVTLRGKQNAENALQGVNGKELDGRMLAVDWAVEKDEWEQRNEVEKPGRKGPKDARESKQDDGEEEEQARGSDSGLPAEAQPKSQDTELDADMDNFLKNHLQNMDDEDENEDESNNESDNKGKTRAGKMGESRPKLETTDNSTTAFIRNLPYSATDEQLKAFFGHFGKIRYARVVMDKTTGNSAGTGFVCFFSQDDVQQCIKHAPQSMKLDASVKHSILQDEGADSTGRYTLEGRLLQVSQAVKKEEAAHLADVSSAKRREKDKRRLFLLNEGSIGSNSPLYQLLSEPEIRMRQASTAQRRKLIQTNPSLHVSLTRLALRNIPQNFDSKELKELARKAVVGFAEDVKGGHREPLSKEENARDRKEAKEQERQRKLKGKGIVRQAKIVFEGAEGSKVPEKSGAGKSRGYGFIEYSSHRWALMGLRYLNGYQLQGPEGRKQRVVVEFSIENAQVVQRRRHTEEKSSQGPSNPGQTARGAQSRRNIVKKGDRKSLVTETREDATPVTETSHKINQAPGDDIQQKLMVRKRLTRKKKAAARGKR